MLNLFRSHTKRSPHKGRAYVKCTCPIWCDWTMLNGQRVRKSLGLRDWQAQGRAWETEAEGITDIGQPVTVKKATEDFEHDAGNNVKPPTLKLYKILLRQLNAFAQQRGYSFLKQLGVVQTRDFRNSWTTYSPRTAGKHIERLKRFFNFCVENHWLDASPAKPLKPPKVARHRCRAVHGRTSGENIEGVRRVRRREPRTIESIDRPDAGLRLIDWRCRDDFQEPYR